MQDRRHQPADYYSQKGETPGRWMGSGLPSLGRPAGRDAKNPNVIDLWSVPEGSEVTEAQMKALFGEGLHPNADGITKHLSGIGLGKAGCHAAARLGRPFRVRDKENAYLRRMRTAYAAYNSALGQPAEAEIDPDTRARIRTAVAREMFTERHDRDPANDRELTGFLARQSRSQTTAVAGYDLTFTPVKSFSVPWALAPRSVAHTLLECHHRAVADAADFGAIPHVDEEAISGLKFSAALPFDLAAKTLGERLADPSGAEAITEARIVQYRAW